MELDGNPDVEESLRADSGVITIGKWRREKIPRDAFIVNQRIDGPNHSGLRIRRQRKNLGKSLLGVMGNIRMTGITGIKKILLSS